jgi:hypothetical protein
MMWPSGRVPFRPPKIRTKRLRASTAETGGQGWLGRQVPSISRAATPAMRTFGPSAHQTGPSPSQTAVGVQANVLPAGTIWPFAGAGMAKVHANRPNILNTFTID